jgi:hypothetical protein
VPKKRKKKKKEGKEKNSKSYYRIYNYSYLAYKLSLKVTSEQRDRKEDVSALFLISSRNTKFL